MPQNLTLRRLLSRKQVQSWLNSFKALDPAAALAIFEIGGRLFARSTSWDEQEPADKKEKLPGDFELEAAGFKAYTLEISGNHLGTLLGRGGDAARSQAITDLAGGMLDIWLAEAHENRVLAQEALERYREINLLYRAGETFGSTLETSTILRMLLEESRQVISADFGYVLLVDPESGWQLANSYNRQNGSFDPLSLRAFLAGKDKSDLQPAIITDFVGSFDGVNFSGLCMLLWAPLSVPGKLLGGIFLGRTKEQPIFVANDQNLLMALTIQAAIALEKAHLFEETKTSARHLQELNTIGRKLATTLNLESLLERILEAAIDLTRAERGSLFLVDKETQEVVFRVVSAADEAFLVGQRLPIGAGIVGQVAETGLPQIVNRVAGNESFFAGIDSTTGYETRSILAVPMAKNEEVVGVIEILNRIDGTPFTDLDSARLTSFSAQAVVAMETARLHQEELTKQRMERELQLGHTMQSSLIPETVPSLTGWQFAAWWQPAREVSGDYYDFIALDEDVGVIIADVADKGVQAALFMALARSTVRTSLRALRQPAQSIFEANRLIAEDAPAGMFLTLCLAQFKPGSGAVTYVNAGHNPPLWFRSDEDEIYELEPTGIFLGLDSGLPIEEKTIECAEDDVIVFFTDGITEAMNPQRELYGEERLQTAVRALHEHDPQQILAQIKEALIEYIQDAPQSDDITIVVAKRY